jgi:hypothetical protein
LQDTRPPHVTTTTTTSTAEDEGATTEHQNTRLVVEGHFTKSQAVPIAMIPTSSSIASCVCIITVAVLQNFDLATKRPMYSLIVDATLAEEAYALALIHLCGVGTRAQDENCKGCIVALHKTRQGTLPVTLLPDITNVVSQVPSAANAAFPLLILIRCRRHESSKYKIMMAISPPFSKSSFSGRQKETRLIENDR